MAAQDGPSADDLADRRYAALEAYWSQLLRLTGLTEWRGRVERDKPEDDGGEPLASVYVRFEGFYYRLRIADRFWEETPAEQRVSLAHELMHLPTFHWATDVMELVTKSISPNAHEIIDEAMNHAFERVVDRLGVMIAPALPLPEFP